MALMLSVSGCRGIVGETLTADVTARFAGSYASWLRERAGGRAVTVVVGRDGRAGSEMVRLAALAGIVGAGCRVVDLGVAMTPTVAVMTDSYARQGGGVAAGMVLTASHNPQQWNGLKCLLAEGGLHGSAACAPPAAFANEIIALFSQSEGRSQGVAWDKVGTVVHDDSGLDEHIGRVLGAMQDAGLCDDPETLGDGLRVAVDCVNASGAVGAPRLLEALGCSEILALNTGDSGLFPHPPEPTRENLSLPGGLCDAVREAGADVGFAQDPDADRLAIIDEHGNYVGEEYTLALGALALLGASGAASPTLVTNLSTSRMLDDVAARQGASVVRTAVGEANVVEAMKRTGALAGGEGNGGVIWPRVAYVRDSLSAMALTVLLLSSQQGKGRRRLSDLIASTPAYAIEKRKVELARRDEAVAAVEKIAAAYRGQHVDRQDGAWVDFREGPLAGRAWLHVRASNTEPIMRLIAEAPTSAQANALLDEAAAAIAR